ncbi:glycosyltransferase family 4 protein [Klebsiella sp. R390]|uniref:glycosyltransferase family 4 protein n=1 Tax=Klebsiella sp. R390 TaxID=2755400 RepID=UPI003DA94C8C
MLIFDLSATQPTETSKFHGGSEYAKAIFLKFITKGFTNFTAVYNEKYELDNEIKMLCVENNIKLVGRYGTGGIVEFVNTTQPTYYYSALPYEQSGIDTKNTIFLMTIHGLREIECPSDIIELSYVSSLQTKLKVFIKNVFFPSRNRKKYKKKFDELLNKENVRIITVSEHTKYSLCSVFPYIKDKDVFVSPAPCPFGPDNVLKTEELQKLNLADDGFFLLVSGNRWLKNNIRAIKALDEFYLKNDNCQIKTVVTGMSSVTIDLKNQDKFIFLGYIEKASLDWLYSSAYCFIYPSLNEGYGYPPLQAMHYGTPVLASSVSSIPEVCENNVLYFDPRNILEIENRINRIYKEEGLYNKLSVLGREHAHSIKCLQDKKLNDVVEFIYYSFINNR